MELRDFIVTPLILFLVYTLAYWFRSKLTDTNTKMYFIPALTVKIVGALAVGFVYQFYYDGGDTFNYHTLGSRVIWDAFIEAPLTGLKLIFANHSFDHASYLYSSRILYYGDISSYFVVRVTALFDLFTFSSYSSTAVLFAVTSFSGSWALFSVFYGRFNNLHKYLAIAIFFIPSVFFWGSGIFKDTLTYSSLCWVVYVFDRLFQGRGNLILNIFILALTMTTIFIVKKYILLCLLPAILIWFNAEKITSIRSTVLRLLIVPSSIVLSCVLAFLAINMVGASDDKYAIQNLAMTAKITAYDIRYGWGARDGIGSGYELGELDGTFASMIRLMPEAINVSLFRPYLWEVRNPLMLLSALESLAILLATLLVLYKYRIIGVFRRVFDPILMFCFTYSIVFAFAVGISTFNFGTLMRYKFPLLPFYVVCLVILYFHNLNEDKTIKQVSAS